jgi:hypothetical protein
MSPTTIVTGATIPDYNHMRIEFGTYVQLFEDNSPSNTLKSRSVGAIALSPTGNAQGDYFFTSLSTGKQLSRASWTALPRTDAAIACVEAIALHQQQSLLQASGLVVEWRPDQPIDDSEYDLDYAPPDNVPQVGFAANNYDAIDDDEVANLLADGPHPFYDPHAAQGAISDGDDSVADDHDDLYGGDDDADDDDANGPDIFDDDDTGFDDDANRGAPNEVAEPEPEQGAPNAAAEQGAPNAAAEQGAHVEAAPHYNLRPRHNNAPNAFQAAIDAPTMRRHISHRDNWRNAVSRSRRAAQSDFH